MTLLDRYLTGAGVTRFCFGLMIETRGPLGSLFLKQYEEHDGTTYKLQHGVAGRVILRHKVRRWFTGLERSAATGRAHVPLTGGTARVEASQGPLRRCPFCGGPLGDDSSLASDGVNEAVRVCSACVSER